MYANACVWICRRRAQWMCICVWREAAPRWPFSITHVYIHSTHNRVTPRVDGLHCAQALPRCQGWNNRYCVIAANAHTAGRMQAGGASCPFFFWQFSHLLKCALPCLCDSRRCNWIIFTEKGRVGREQETSFLLKLIKWALVMRKFINIQQLNCRQRRF